MFETIEISHVQGQSFIPLALDTQFDRVYVKRVGNALYIIPMENPWRNLWDSLGDFTEDYMEQREQDFLEERPSFSQ